MRKSYTLKFLDCIFSKKYANSFMSPTHTPLALAIAIVTAIAMAKPIAIGI